MAQIPNMDEGINLFLMANNKVFIFVLVVAILGSFKSKMKFFKFFFLSISPNLDLP